MSTQNKIDQSISTVDDLPLANTRHSFKPIQNPTNNGNRFSLVKECYVDNGNVNNVVFKISELPPDFQNAAKKFDLDNSGTIDQNELAGALQHYEEQSKVINFQRRLLWGSLVLLIVAFSGMFVTSYMAIQLAKDFRPSENGDGSLVLGDGTVVKTANSDFTVNAKGELVETKEAVERRRKLGIDAVQETLGVKARENIFCYGADCQHNGSRRLTGNTNGMYTDNLILSVTNKKDNDRVRGLLVNEIVETMSCKVESQEFNGDAYEKSNKELPHLVLRITCKNMQQLKLGFWIKDFIDGYPVLDQSRITGDYCTNQRFENELQRCDVNELDPSDANLKCNAEVTCKLNGIQEIIAQNNIK